jgi:hypothetical protein
VATLEDLIKAWPSFPPSIQRMLHDAALRMLAGPPPASTPPASTLPASTPPASTPLEPPVASPLAPIPTIAEVMPALLEQSPSVALRRLAPEFAHVARQLTLQSALEHVDPLRSNARVIAARVLAARERAAAINAGPAPHPFLADLWAECSRAIQAGLLAGPLNLSIAFDNHKLRFSLEADDRRWVTVSIEGGAIEADADTDVATQTALLVGLLQALAADAPNELLAAVEAASQVSRTTRELTDLVNRCLPLILRPDQLLTWQADFDAPSLRPMVRRDGEWVPVPLEEVDVLQLSNRERTVVRLLQHGGMPALIQAFATLAGFPRVIDVHGEALALTSSQLMFRILSDSKRGVSLRAVANGRLLARDRLREAVSTRATLEHILFGFGPIQILEVNPATLAALDWWLDASPRSHALESEAEFQEALGRLQPWVPVEGLTDASDRAAAEGPEPEPEPLLPMTPGEVDFKQWRIHYMADCDRRLREGEISSSTHKIYVRTMDRLLEILSTDFPNARTKAEVASVLDGWIERMRRGEVGLKSDPNNVPQVRRRAIGLLPDDLPTEP